MSQEKQVFSMGGQAVLEGVMMNAPTHYAVSVRREDGVIISDVVERAPKSRTGILSWPIIRGAVRFAESLALGMKVLDFSAEIYGGSEDDKESGAAQIVAYILGIALAVGLFIVVPSLISKLILRKLLMKPWALTVCEGVLRILIFLGYMLLVSKVKDVARTFEFHGAEHKVVNCYEAGLALTVENARAQSRLNKRCGTSYIVIIMVFSIILFMFIPVSNTLARIGLKLLLLPVMAGISYEILKFSAKSESRFINALVKPGLWFQKISTKEPDDSEIEVALLSAIRILEAEDLPVPEGSASIEFEQYQKQ